MSQFQFLYKQESEDQIKKAGKQSSLRVEGTTQAGRNRWASLFMIPLHMDVGWDLYPGSLANL